MNPSDHGERRDATSYIARGPIDLATNSTVSILYFVVSARQREQAVVKDERFSECE